MLYFTVLGEPTIKMLRYQRQFSFFDPALVGTGVRYVNLSDEALHGDLPEGNPITMLTFDAGVNIFGVTNWVRTLNSIPAWWGATGSRPRSGPAGRCSGARRAG